MDRIAASSLAGRLLIERLMQRAKTCCHLDDSEKMAGLLKFEQMEM